LAVAREAHERLIKEVIAKLSRHYWGVGQVVRRAQCGALQPTSNTARLQKGKTWMCRNFRPTNNFKKNLAI